MNSLQIEGLLKKDPQAKKIFKKVCALEEIEMPSYPSAYVINSETSDRKGEHWVAVCFEKKQKWRILRQLWTTSYSLWSKGLHGLLFAGLDLHLQNYTKIIFKCVWTLLCIFYFISLS